MKRKFDETCGSSYTEARSLVLNISLGKLHSNSPKPVEPSLWRSLLIAKVMHRISEELKLEASGANKTATTDDRVVEEILKDQQLDALFLLQNPPLAVLLSESESRAVEDVTVSDDCAMQLDDADTRSSLTTLGTCLPLDSDIVGSQVPFQVGGNTISHIHNQSSADDSVTGFSSVSDDFDEIDCACLESFQGGDLSDLGTSMDRDFLLGGQTPLSFHAFSSAYEHFQDFGSISELDCLMQVLEEECIFPLKF